MVARLNAREYLVLIPLWHGMAGADSNFGGKEVDFGSVDAPRSELLARSLDDGASIWSHLLPAG